MTVDDRGLIELGDDEIRAIKHFDELIKLQFDRLSRLRLERAKYIRTMAYPLSKFRRGDTVNDRGISYIVLGVEIEPVIGNPQINNKWRLIYQVRRITRKGEFARSFDEFISFSDNVKSMDIPHGKSVTRRLKYIKRLEKGIMSNP